MAEIPTLEQEDAKRPNREHESLVSERTRVINRMKACMVRLGIRGFNPKLRKAPELLAGLRTPEGQPVPPNMQAELKHQMERLQLIRKQIIDAEKARFARLHVAPRTEPHAQVRLLCRVVGIGIETADMLVHEVLWRKLRDRRAVARYAGLTGAPDQSGEKSYEKGLAKPAMPGCAAA